MGFVKLIFVEFRLTSSSSHPGQFLVLGDSDTEFKVGCYFHVLLDSEERVQVVVLCDVTGHLAEQVQVPNAAIHINCPVDIRLFIAGEDIEERTFTSTRGPHN